MKLTNVRATNLKGLSFSLALEPITFLCGPNYVGKSARTDAIRLALAGFLPELGQTNAATFGLASGKGMAVYAAFDDGSGIGITRTWTVKGDSIKSESTVPPNLDPKGGDLFEVMLNAESWFGLTERERVEWVFRNCKTSSDLTPSTISTMLRSKIIEADVPGTSTALLDKFFSDFNEKAFPRKELFPTQEWLDSALVAASEAAKEAKAHAVTMDKTVAGLAGLRANDAPSVNLPELEGRIARLTAEIGDLRDENAKVLSKVAPQDKAEKRRADLVKELSEIVGAKAELARRIADRDAVAEKIAKLNAERDAFPEIDAEEVDRLRAEDREAYSALAGHRRDREGIDETLNRITEEMRDLSSKKNCPYCGADHPGWRLVKLEEIERTVAGLNSKRETTTENINKLSAHVDSLRTKIKGVEARQNERAELQKRINKAKDDLSSWNAGIRSSESIIAGFAGLQGELDAIPARVEGLEAELEEIAKEIGEKRDFLAKLDAERKSALGRAGDLKRLAEAEKGRNEAKVEQKMAEAACDALREIKAKMVADAFGPLLKVANSFCGSLLKTPLEFNAVKSEVGTYRDGMWVGHRTFSGVEKLLAYAGIQAAFAANAPVRVMILDEMLRAQGDVLADLVRACKRAVRDGVIDNFVGIWPGTPHPGELGESEPDCQVVFVK